MLWRLALQPDRRFWAAAAGIGVAVLLPVAGSLLLQGLEPEVKASDGWITVAPNAGALDRLPDSDVRALVEWRLDESWVGAYRHGGPPLSPGEVLPMPGADRSQIAARFPGAVILEAPREPLPLAPSDGIVVAQLEQVDGAVAWTNTPVAGLPSSPARGVDAFEVASLEGLTGNVFWLVAASLPAVAAVAFAFVSLEADRFARTSATLAALGHPQAGRLVLSIRVTMAAGLGTALAGAAGLALWLWGPAGFHPRDTSKLGVALALLLPGATAILAGVFTLGRPLRSGTAQLRSPMPDESPPERRLAWIPIGARPLLLGHRVILILIVAGLLFGADVGLPLAATQIPASLAGEQGEWVKGAEAGIIVGGSTLAAATVLVNDPVIESAIAEIMVPTLVDGLDVVLRGGDWDALVEFHRVDDGTPPRPGEVSLGARLAGRMGVDVGDEVMVQASHRPLAIPLRVVGIHAAPGLLEDEGIVHTTTARDLAGLGPGEATVVRVRPATDAALEALQRTEARIEVLDLSIVPSQPPAGSVFRMDASIANLASGAGSRTLTFRVAGAAIHQENVQVSGYGTQVVSAFAIAPPGEYRVEVNPTTTMDGGIATADLDAPIAFSDAPASVAVQRGGSPLADVVVRVFDSLESSQEGGSLEQALTDADGVAQIQLPPGNYTVTAAGQAASLTVSPAEFRNRTVIVIDRLWTDPNVAQVGQSVAVHASVVNLGGVQGDERVAYVRDEIRFAYLYVDLQPGERANLKASFQLLSPQATVHVNDNPVVVGGRQPSWTFATLQDDEVRSADDLRGDVADHVLGDARRALGSLMLVALLSSLAVVYLATERTLRGRVHVARVLHALGQDYAAVRRRAAWEAVGLAAAAFLGAAALLKLGLAGSRQFGAPVVFAHVLPDPFGPLLTLQSMAIFCTTAGWAAYLAAGTVLREKR